MKLKLFVFLVGLGVALATLSSSAQVKKGKTRLLETRHWMRGINAPNCGALSNLLKDAGPADDKAWEMAAQHAEILNESGHVLMADGRCPNAAWAEGGKQLRESSEAVLRAIEARNAVEARTAFAQMVKGCDTCHATHRKKQ